MKLGLKMKILAGASVPLTLLLILGFISINSINTITETNKMVEHTHKVIKESNNIIGSAVDMETGMRGYLLAGKEDFLDPYKGGEKATYKQISSLKQTVNDNPKQVTRLAEVEETLKSWQANVTEPNIALRRQIGDADTMNDMADLVGEARGKVYFDKFREQITTFVGRESELLVQRQVQTVEAENNLTGNLKLLKDTNGWVEHTHQVLASVSLILAHAVDMETGMRGYLLAGERGFLEPYNKGSKAFSNDMVLLKKEVSDNPAQVERLTTGTTIKNTQCSPLIV